MEKEKQIEILKNLINGGWVDTESVQQALDISFEEGFDRFEFSRTAEWWSVVGETDEERNLNGQKITTCFRLKNISSPSKLATEAIKEFAEGLIQNGVYSCSGPASEKTIKNLVDQFENHIRNYAKEYGVNLTKDV